VDICSSYVDDGHGMIAQTHWNTLGKVTLDRYLVT